MIERLSIYADGRWQDRSSAERIAVADPTTEETIGAVAAGTESDVEEAVAAAGRARDNWAALPFLRRAEYLAAIADGLERRREELVETIILEVGTPRTTAETMQVDAAIGAFRDLATGSGDWAQDETVGTSDIRRVPIGVAGLITPWNYPLYQIALKMAPALAAGCPVVLKPSEVAPLNAFLLADAVHEAGFPAGVFNLVVGSGTVVGEAIVRHPGVDVVSFTGSVRAGQRVAALAAEGVKKVTLELGGKGASVALKGADIGAAVAHCVRSCFSNAGQTCAALTRLIVPHAVLSEVEACASEIARGYVIGDPRDRATQLGPLVSATQRERVLSFVASGIQEGARLLVGSAERKLPETGYFVPPTIFSDVTSMMTIAQEEIFGPVLAILPVDDDEQGIAVANATRYGLTAAVWAPDLHDARRAAARIRAGSVTLNGGKFNPAAPFGGFKQSGFGRERGRFGLDEFLTTKSFNH
jgi:betaine-aldehyde dehydrogenase